MVVMDTGHPRGKKKQQQYFLFQPDHNSGVIGLTQRQKNYLAFIINKAKHVLPPKELTTLYNSIAKPHLDYACEIWGHTNKTFLSPLEIMQKRIVRSIFNLQHRSHTTEYFYKANILKLQGVPTPQPPPAQLELKKVERKQIYNRIAVLIDNACAHL